MSLNYSNTQIQIGNGTRIKNSVISSGTVVIGNEVTINGVKCRLVPPKDETLPLSMVRYISMATS